MTIVPMMVSPVMTRTDRNHNLCLRWRVESRHRE